MIDVFFMTSPNVDKVCIALEEVGFDYRLIPTDVTHRSKLNPESLGGAINGKLPVIIDRDPPEGGETTVFESGAILQYLAERSGMLLPSSFAGRMEVMQWLFWQVGGLGPFGGQCFHFRAIAPAVAPGFNNSYSRSRYANIVAELWSVMERRLSDHSYLAGEYSIADIACYPWIAYLEPDNGAAAYPHVSSWRDSIKDRPAVVRAYARSREVDMGYPRNELDTVIYPLENVRRAVTL